MKIFLIILCVLILFLTIILLFPVPVSLKIKWDKEIENEVKLFGKTLTPKGTLKKVLKHLGFKGTLSFVFSEKTGLFRRIKYLLKNLKVKKFRLYITVAGEDAAQTALTYGGVCSLLYPLVAFLEANMNFSEDDMKIRADYEKETPDLYFFTQIKVRVITALIAIFTLLPTIIKLLKEVNKNEQHS